MAQWSLPRSLMMDDEEMAKKDDDLPRSRRHTRAASWQANKPHAMRRSSAGRFAIYTLFVVFLLYIYSQYRGGGVYYEDGETPLRSPGRFMSQHRGAGYGFDDSLDLIDDRKHDMSKNKQKPKGQAKGKQSGQATVSEPAYFTGPIQFPRLAMSLRASGSSGGRNPRNRNILIAASSLRAVANVLPFACQMAGDDLSSIHVAIMSRHDVPIKDLLAINGVTEDCHIRVHDARVDHNDESSNTRLAVASLRAFDYLATYVHPQVVIVDGSISEEGFFIESAREQLKTAKIPLIELPSQAYNTLSWISKLDAVALSAWHDVHFDILIQAPFTGSGNLIRLLRSLAAADIAGHPMPHITIDLPSTVEPALEEFLDGFHWPPSSAKARSSHMLSLRHRIKNKKLTEEESSVRFIESFWPNKPANSHVLILSPNTEVTPDFFHYVRYELLHRLYSISGQSRNADGGLFGLSLAQPRLDPHTDKPFVPPASASKDGKMADDTSFLWQMPGTDAMLVFGDKWVELHGYISQLHDQSHGKDPASGLLSKQTTAKQPVWIEHMIQLSRLRGYLTLYPSKATASSIITVHDDLVDVPEEFLDREQQPRPPKPTELAKEDQRQSLSNVAMIKTLPKNGELVHLLHMPVVSWDGEVTSREDVRVQARSHLQKFRSDVGGCAAHEGPVAKDRLARDLFCKVK